MSAAHTPGPLAQSHRKGADGMHRTEIYSEEYGGIATCEWTPKNLGNGVTGTYREANARRLVACWNACDGVETDLLEKYPSPFSEMRAQRDALLEALTNVESLFSEKCSASCMTQADLQAIEESRAAIAKATT